MGPYEAASLDALVGCREILSRRVAPHGRRFAVSRASSLRRLVYMWVAAAVVLAVSIRGTTAQPNSGATAAQPKQILFLSIRPKFPDVDHMEKGDPQ